MTIDLALEPQREAKLLALANAKGLSADDLVREAVDSMLDAVPGQAESTAHNAHQTGCALGVKPKKSLYGLWANHGPGPSEQEIDENRREMFRGFAEVEP